MGRRPLSRTLDVYLNGRLAGFYRYNPQGGASFEYSDSWLDWENAFALSRQLPLDLGRQVGPHVNAVFENLLPDNAALRRLIAERTEARSDRPFDLLAAIGHDCVGAMQFLPHDAEPGDPFRIEGEPQTEAQIAHTLRQLSVAPLGIDESKPFRISLAGAQEKTAYLRQGGAWLRPEGLTPTTHIFKRPMGVLKSGLDMTDSVENEHLCLLLAREMGLPANRTEIAHFEDQVALVIERFDRAPRPAGGIVRLPQEDFLQAMGLESAQKYQQHGGPSMVDCLQLLSSADDPGHDMKLFLKAQVFNWMVAGIDGHAKNYSIFLRPTRVRRFTSITMTPLYDIMSAAPDHLREKFRHKDLQLAMAVGNNNHYRGDQIHPRHFDQTAVRARLPAQVRLAAYSELAEAMPAAIEHTAAALPAGFPARIADQILAYARDRHRVLSDYVATLGA